MALSSGELAADEVPVGLLHAAHLALATSVRLMEALDRGLDRTILLRDDRMRGQC